MIDGAQNPPMLVTVPVTMAMTLSLEYIIRSVTMLMRVPVAATNSQKSACDDDEVFTSCYFVVICLSIEERYFF